MIKVSMARVRFCFVLDFWPGGGAGGVGGQTEGAKQVRGKEDHNITLTLPTLKG